jgi:hypothetical protein
MTDSEILRAFESLGDNCEFGLVQSSVGTEQLSLFRFNSVSTDALLRAIESDFVDFENPQAIEIEIACNDEFVIHVRKYGFRFHTFYHRDDVEIDRLRRQQISVLRFLARKFREDLRAGNKIFVRKSATSSYQEIVALHGVLRRYSEATLLWVARQDDTKRTGAVEVLAPGLLKGHIDRFSEYTDASASSFAWFDICREAHAIWRGNVPLARRADDVRTTGQYRTAALDEVALDVIAGTPGEYGSLSLAIVHDAIVLGGQGIVTVGDSVIAETICPLPGDAPATTLQVNGSGLVVPKLSHTLQVSAAYHLFAPTGADEESRCADTMSRFSKSLYDSFERLVPNQPAPILLIPDMEDFGLLSALRRVAPRRVPRLAIPAGHAVRVQRLCIPYWRVT